MENPLINDAYGTLFLIPTPIGDSAPLEVLPLAAKKNMEVLTHFIVENEKVARRFIKKITPNKNQDTLILYPLNKYTTQEETATYLEACLQGESMGVLSDVGCPGVADPGSIVVRMAHQHGIRVKPLTGPSSILLALMSSGMNGQSFAFNGYLPIDKSQRQRAIKRYEKKAQKDDQTQIFIETPYRNDALVQDFIKVLEPSTLLCIACDLSMVTEMTKTLPVALWKKNIPELQKRPCIFLIHPPH
ncbi:SAM-dependent methyltransferase [Flavobacteriaceae bacterium]|jgi:16S rRNA (cytidine1402-2'-O)-methyltransferase|nr:SAM-dependent methyltransferase [Flavobacteriaceae bacterium]MDA7711792.1 SAM-dependent methyltransferase [Flavobacteriaceae bacterium]MDA8900262.1 SAM-dependent methyltransferase [Flavobacteriaceae bacterium]